MSAQYYDAQGFVRAAIAPTQSGQDACCIANGIKTNQFAVSDTITAAIDESHVVPNRIVIAFWNAGSKTLEVKENNPDFAFGTGWPIPSGQGLVIKIDEGTYFYAKCGSGDSSDLRVIQLSEKH